jgi:hypothetical protein
VPASRFPGLIAMVVTGPRRVGPVARSGVPAAVQRTVFSAALRTRGVVPPVVRRARGTASQARGARSFEFVELASEVPNVLPEYRHLDHRSS